MVLVRSRILTTHVSVPTWTTFCGALAEVETGSQDVPTMTLLADPMLLEILSSTRGKDLSSIVATIQADQDRLIRSTDRALIIQGGAGTGKTVVALHRLAYLLYYNR